jgi:hypothetical protein
MRYKDTYLTHTFYHEELSLIVFKTKMDTIITLDALKENYAATFQLVEERTVKALVDIRPLAFHHIPIEALRYFSDSPYSKYQLQIAVLIKGLGQKLLGNFYLSTFKPKVPTKIFTKEEQAAAWLSIEQPYHELTVLSEVAI